MNQTMFRSTIETTSKSVNLIINKGTLCALQMQYLPKPQVSSPLSLLDLALTKQQQQNNVEQNRNRFDAHFSAVSGTVFIESTKNTLQ